MSSTITIGMKDFAAHLASGNVVDIERAKDAMVVAARAGIKRIQREMMAPTEPRGDGSRSFKTVGVNGIYFKSWQARRIPEGAVLYSDVPYAGFVEWGTRPGHRMNPAVLYRWIMMKMAGSFSEPRGNKDPMWFEKQVRSTAFAIARSIKRHGIYPRFILRNSLPDIARQMGSDIKRLLASGPRV